MNAQTAGIDSIPGLREQIGELTLREGAIRRKATSAVLIGGGFISLAAIAAGLGQYLGVGEYLNEINVPSVVLEAFSPGATGGVDSAFAGLYDGMRNMAPVVSIAALLGGFVMGFFNLSRGNLSSIFMPIVLASAGFFAPHLVNMLAHEPNGDRPKEVFMAAVEQHNYADVKSAVASLGAGVPDIAKDYVMAQLAMTEEGASNKASITPAMLDGFKSAKLFSLSPEQILLFERATFGEAKSPAAKQYQLEVEGRQSKCQTVAISLGWLGSLQLVIGGVGFLLRSRIKRRVDRITALVGKC